jgi:hypothetical protein
MSFPYDVYIHRYGRAVMVRTQIYLDERQKSALEKLSSDRGVSISVLIRQAVDKFIVKASTDFEEALELSFGIWKNRPEFSDSSEYMEKLRKEWKEREGRI